MFGKNTSLFTMLGIPTLGGGVVATAIALIAGSEAGVLSDQRYWPAIAVAVAWILVGLAATLWGLRRGTKGKQATSD